VNDSPILHGEIRFLARVHTPWSRLSRPIRRPNRRSRSLRFPGAPSLNLQLVSFANTEMESSPTLANPVCFPRAS
jgi:hypothetical protein